MSNTNGNAVVAEADAPAPEVQPAPEPTPVEQMKADMAHYAAERDKHFAASETHKVAAHQFAGAYDAMVRAIALLEKPEAAPGA